MSLEVFNLKLSDSKCCLDARWVSVVFVLPVSTAPSHDNNILISFWETNPVPLSTWFGWGLPTPCYSKRHMASPASIPPSIHRDGIRSGLEF